MSKRMNQNHLTHVSLFTGILNAGRHYIGIEKNPEYVTIARNRAAEAHGQTKLSITEWEDGI